MAKYVRIKKKNLFESMWLFCFLIRGLLLLLKTGPNFENQLYINETRE